jgi:peptidoglycan/LPS O-acetylase OafA/YrhL
MISPTIRKISAAALAVVGVIHLVLSPEYLSEQTYIGVLFIAGGLFLCGLAVALWRADNVPSWLLGALTMAAMGIAFVLSRTTGLPGFKESEWELSGIVALVLEAGFVAVAIPALAPRRDTVAPAARTADDRRFSREPAAERSAARREADVRA